MENQRLTSPPSGDLGGVMELPKEIVIATGNKGKLGEFKTLFKDLPIALTSLRDYWNPIVAISEDGATFYENALGKAQWVYSQLGKPSLADDSGLEVDFLKGLPGVRSARFAGEGATDTKNLEKLLLLLIDCPREKRQARFRCVLVFVASPQLILTAEGVCEGEIGFSAVGENGFGYDPVFIPHGFSETFAQVNAAIKNKISHRAKALIQLKEKLYGIISFT